ncbi:hypothetical protein [Ktedonospora formicarum]|uniref:Uncharacterized protein n=1 Tax=Ktedonospora formicarum TaxID=2778364 RepID=A0A8J3IAV3_9CHLR|nr:hypothetical protein [Ktedonospora formicarum]GHO50498.1 hypothetical protein KSX_86610 [Ktedonospora formicarum]
MASSRSQKKIAKEAMVSSREPASETREEAMWNGLIGGASDLIDVFVLHLLGGPREEGMQIFSGLWSNAYWQRCDAVCAVVHRKVLPPVVLARCECPWTDAL